MKSKSLTLSQVKKEIEKQVSDSTPKAVIDAISSQTFLAQQARLRVDEEGIVVRSNTGAVIEHPAISVEQKALKFVCDQMQKYGYIESVQHKKPRKTKKTTLPQPCTPAIPYQSPTRF